MTFDCFDYIGSVWARPTLDILLMPTGANGEGVGQNYNVSYNNSGDGRGNGYGYSGTIWFTVGPGNGVNPCCTQTGDGFVPYSRMHT